MDFTLDTTEKVISAIAGAIAIGTFVFMKKRDAVQGAAQNGQANSSTNTQTVNVNMGPPTAPPPHETTPSSGAINRSIADLKKTIRVLFIDDDKGFKIVGVLKKMGWELTSIVTDIRSLEQATLVEADVVFVDIQGVGKAMQYADEGLGLALAIKRRYPSKRIVIYSAQEEGARFHEALQEADYSLPKTAEPIRFEDTIVRVLSQ